MCFSLHVCGKNVCTYAMKCSQQTRSCTWSLAACINRNCDVVCDVYLYTYTYIMFMSTSKPHTSDQHYIATIQTHKHILTSNQSLIIPHNKSFQTPRTYNHASIQYHRIYWRKVYEYFMLYTTWMMYGIVYTYIFLMPSGTIAMLVQWQGYF